MLAQRRDDVARPQRARPRAHARRRPLGDRELRLPGGRVRGRRPRARQAQRPAARGRQRRARPRHRRRPRRAAAHARLSAASRSRSTPSYLDDRTVHGDPTLLHGYAMTVHVAQGLTVDHAFVLAGPGLNRELGYTALSRGRESNHLYAARDPDTARVEYAPDRPAPRRPDRAPHRPARDELGDHAGDRHRAASRLGAPARRRATRPPPRPSLVDAPRRRSRGRWLPGRRRQLEQLRRSRGPLATPCRDLRRAAGRARHGARPFVDRPRRPDADPARWTADRRAPPRARAGGRDLGRGLER